MDPISIMTRLRNEWTREDLYVRMILYCCTKLIIDTIWEGKGKESEGKKGKEEGKRGRGRWRDIVIDIYFWVCWLVDSIPLSHL